MNQEESIEEQYRRWRLILGKQAVQSDEALEVGLEEKLQAMDETLEALYDSERAGGLGNSSPNINRWLGDIRKYFPAPIVEVVQKDALEKLDLDQLLKEPEFLEMLEPNVDLVATILTLNKVLPAQTKASARLIVQKLVDKVTKMLQEPMRASISGAINRAQRNRNPSLKEINWHKTILANLKNYRPEVETIIPEKFIGYGKQKQQLKEVILLIDQSGSMASSVVYSGIIGSILAGLNSLKTRLIVFDTNVVDLTEQLEDPVALLFATQLGGGTNIGKALQYATQLVSKPSDTIIFLVSDLYEGGSVGPMMQYLSLLLQRGVNIISILALSDQGVPSYDRSIATQLAHMDIPAFACDPNQFPELLSAAIAGKRLKNIKSKGLIVKN